MTRIELHSIRTALLVTFVSLQGFSQSTPFVSGSTGADGALSFPANAGVVYFDPANFPPRLDNIYHFTTITIPVGTTVRLSGWLINGPVYWLATGDVQIQGTVDLTGKPGHLRAQVPPDACVRSRAPAVSRAESREPLLSPVRHLLRVTAPEAERQL